MVLSGNCTVSTQQDGGTAWMQCNVVTYIPYRCAVASYRVSWPIQTLVVTARHPLSGPQTAAVPIMITWSIWHGA